jgi:transposase
MSIFVRAIGDHEGRKLAQILRRSTSRVKVRRAQVILASAQGMKVPEIARLTHLCEHYVRTLIRRFDEEGLSSLEPHFNGGRPPGIGEEQKAEIVETALVPPSVMGLPFTRWSLSKLREHLMSRGIVTAISRERLRQILKEAKVSHQRTRTWKESNDPAYEAKKNASSGSTQRRPREGK